MYSWWEQVASPRLRELLVHKLISSNFNSFRRLCRFVYRTVILKSIVSLTLCTSFWFPFEAIRFYLNIVVLFEATFFYPQVCKASRGDIGSKFALRLVAFPTPSRSLQLAMRLVIVLFNSETTEWVGNVGDVLEFFNNQPDRQLMDDGQPDLRVSLLLAAVGMKNVHLLISWCVPEYTNAMAYSKFMDVLRRHFQTQTTGFAARHVFHSRKQRKKDPVADDAVELRRLVAKCDYSKTEIENQLIDQFAWHWSGMFSLNCMTKLVCIWLSSNLADNYVKQCKFKRNTYSTYSFPSKRLQRPCQIEVSTLVLEVICAGRMFNLACHRFYLQSCQT